MSRIPTGSADLSYYQHGEPTVEAHVALTDASNEAAQAVLEADLDSIDGRSQWVWIRFPNGDLFLAVAPQGDTYFEAEGIEDARQAQR